MLEAVIFDFDGVIVDSESLHWRAFREVLVPLGFDFGWDEYLEGYVGLDDRDGLRKAFRTLGRPLDDTLLARLIGEKAQAFQCLAAQGVSPYPGVLELIAEAAERLPVALCSGALRSDILPVLAGLGLERHFPVLVSAEEVKASKPDPESYALALQRLAERHPGRIRGPASCLAIEDTPAGIASARGAGMSVLAVTNNFPPEKLAGADRIAGSLEGWHVADLEAIVGAVAFRRESP